MKCKLCQEKEADKKNTHYLTDSIIRSCLNQDGSNEREKGVYFDLSTDKIFTDFNFQRGATTEVLETTIGRPANEEEIEKAKKIPFSVDNFFCSSCEDIFTEIESKFAADFLPQFRSSDLSNKDTLKFEGKINFRLFFLMQVWRTNACTELFKISAEASEQIRKLILNPDESQLKEFPLIITYLQTTGGQMAYTSNFVGYASGSNPNIIFMNDFVIQFFEQGKPIRCNPWFGINDSTTFRSFLNHKESKFTVKVISNKKRKEIMNATVTEFKIKPLFNLFQIGFIQHWTRKYKTAPSSTITEKYIKELVNWDDIPQVQRLSEERIRQYTNDFLKEHGT